MDLKPGRSQTLVGNGYQYNGARKIKENEEISMADPHPRVLVSMVISIWKGDSHSPGPLRVRSNRIELSKRTLPALDYG